MPLIDFDNMKQLFHEILVKNGFSDADAETCAEVFATNSLEGVYSHGINRFPKFIEDVKSQIILPGAIPFLKYGRGNFEQWDGALAPGPLNAIFATERAIELAQQNHIACIALSNTNHWMRGGYYAWQAAKKKCILIAWTNTIANTPAWGATDARLGNNPFIMGIPFNQSAIVMDMAMSQYAHGKLQVYANKHQELEVPGGYDESGNLSTDAAAILASNRKLPMGYWKGAGMSLLLDILAMILSNGKSVSQISESKIEYAVSQVFIAIDLKSLPNFPGVNYAIREVLNDYLLSVPVNDQTKIVYPGENVLRKKQENLKKGIPVDDAIWKTIMAL